MRRAPPGGAAVAVLLLAFAPPPSLQAQQGLEPLTTGPSPGAVAARSLVLPGWGQWTRGQRRGLAYGIAEAALWVFWADRRNKGADFRDAYRDLAWETARSRTGPRVDGPWDYYEALTKWRRSGAFDRDGTAPGVQPEDDPSTFNGSIWELARDLHFGGSPREPTDPAYQAALAFYRERAWGEAYLWDWTGREHELEEFEALIDRSDERFRQATTALGAVLANHLLSGVDAFLSTRVAGETASRVVPAGAQGGPGVTFLLTWTPPS